MKFIAFSFALVLSTSLLSAQYAESPDNPTELGKVRWMRDYDKAIMKAKTEDKPVFILFQEVPGCHTCTTYGKGVMSHPLIVEAIETYFIPLAIYNNKKGKDADILALYKEPSWNNPVARIVNHKGKDIVKRLSGAYSIDKVANGIANALTIQAKDVPLYLELLIQEYEALDVATDYYSMYCFWSGEGKLGGLDGVIDTKAGFMDGHEVVKITYNPQVISSYELLESAKKYNVVSSVYTDNDDTRKAAQNREIRTKETSRFKLDKDPKYQIQRIGLAHVPMTSLQASRVNAAIYANKNYRQFLSPRQLIIADQKGVGKNVVEQDITSIWWQ